MSVVTGDLTPVGPRPAIAGRLLRYVRRDSSGVLPAEWHILNIKIEALRSTSRTLVVQCVGPSRQGGTTLIASGFAMAAAQRSMGHRNSAAMHAASSVLLVDCDSLPAKPRRPRRGEHHAETLLQAFQRDQTIGTILGAPVSNGVVRARLGVIDSEGTPNCPPDDLAKLFGAARERFSLVVLDTPALEVSLASLLLAAHCDGTLMVVRAAVTKSSDVQSARQEIEQAGGRVVGVIFNRAASPGGRGLFGLSG